jgi:enolase-phosphatase E1
MAVQAVVSDIEGTTTALSFVHFTLFPISYSEMESYLRNHSDLVRIEMESVRKEIAGSERSPSEVKIEEVTDALKRWIKEDRKHPALKSVQGKIWRQSYESGQVKGHVYPDVLPNFRKWINSGILISIFSSGSIEAQRLLFRYSLSGDLTAYISHYFDTTTGPKKELTSYLLISARLGMDPSQILFLSDTVEELDAARSAGMQTFQLVREDTAVVGNHPIASTLDEVSM